MQPAVATAANTVEVVAIPAVARPIEARPTSTTPSAATVPRVEPAVAVSDEGPDLTPSRPPADPLSEIGSDLLALPAPEREAPSEVQVAAVAWSGGDGARFDPVSLAAIQTFTSEASLSGSASDAGGVRDEIQNLFADIPCSRLMVEYNPDTGTLDLRGHLPDPEFRQPVLAALQARMGASIPVRDSTMFLPRPQCGVLTAIEAAGLPQSTDQLNNPRLIGENTHVRLYSFVTDECLELDMESPDYPAYVYVDYYAADGSVIHLMPNEHVSARNFGPKTLVKIGSPCDVGAPLEIRIAPPYGQEIAVAFASSVPLHNADRPLVEPAGEYLTWMREQVQKARETTPDFKGEWVYFLVSTSEG